MTAKRIIARSIKEASIRTTTRLSKTAGLGKYALAFATGRQISNTPWTYYDYIYRLPILHNQTTVKCERYTDGVAWEVTPQLGQTRLTPR